MLSSCPPSTTRTWTAEDSPFSQLGHEEDPTSRLTCGLTALVVRGILCRPPVGPPSTVSFCSVHSHLVVAGKRTAATFLHPTPSHTHDRRRRGLHWRRLQHGGQRFFCRRDQQRGVHGTGVFFTAVGHWRFRRGPRRLHRFPVHAPTSIAFCSSTGTGATNSPTSSWALPQGTRPNLP